MKTSTCVAVRVILCSKMMMMMMMMRKHIQMWMLTLIGWRVGNIWLIRTTSLTMGLMRKRNVRMGKMGCRYDDKDEDRPVIHFDRGNPTIDEWTVFDTMEECRYAVATYAIRV